MDADSPMYSRYYIPTGKGGGSVQRWRIPPSLLDQVFVPRLTPPQSRRSIRGGRVPGAYCACVGTQRPLAGSGLTPRGEKQPFSRRAQLILVVHSSNTVRAETSLTQERKVSCCGT